MTTFEQAVAHVTRAYEAATKIVSPKESYDTRLTAAKIVAAAILATAINKEWGSE